jgi:ubiquinone/menaquinone biosynthesis C-methylase UbiE
MKDYEPVMSFDRDEAERYDRIQRFSGTPSRRDRDATVAFLAKEARGGPALELAVGTGWIALPLAASGIRVDGIDLSPDMVAQLRAKPGGEQISVTVGDMTEVELAGKYRLVYIVANSLFNVLSQEGQVRCFENVARHLAQDGVFVVEAFVPMFLYRLEDDQYVHAEAIEVGEVRLDVARHDPVRQLLDESHVVLSREGVRLNPIVTRYAWPAELDLMARIAGLRLSERWGGWKGEPFTGASSTHVSVYAR